jgi:hypothetical protein
MGHGIFVATPLAIALVLACSCASVGEGMVSLIHKATLGAGTGMLLGRILAERIAMPFCFVCIAAGTASFVFIMIPKGPVSEAVCRSILLGTVAVSPSVLLFI